MVTAHDPILRAVTLAALCLVVASGVTLTRRLRESRATAEQTAKAAEETGRRLRVLVAGPYRYNSHDAT